MGPPGDDPLAQIYQSAAQGIRPLRASFLLLVAAGLALLVPLASHGWLFLITVLMALCLIGPAAIAWQRDRFDAFEIIHVLGFRYVLYFGIGALWLVADPYEVAYDYYLLPYVTKAALYCLLGYVCMLGGYYGPWFRKQEPREFEDLPTGASVLLLPGVLGVVGNLADALVGRAFWMGSARGLPQPWALRIATRARGKAPSKHESDHPLAPLQLDPLTS